MLRIRRESGDGSRGLWGRTGEVQAITGAQVSGSERATSARQKVVRPLDFTATMTIPLAAKTLVGADGIEPPTAGV
jgi:hypothetical protein